MSTGFVSPVLSGLGVGPTLTKPASRRPTAMNRLLLPALIAGLSLFCALPAAALRSIGPITKQDAGELGIKVTATPSGPEAAWVTLEFTPKGKLKDYSHVELEIEEGGKPVIAYAVLGETRGANGSVSLTFMVSRAFLPKVTLSIVTGFPGNFAGNQLALRDFVNVAEIR